MIGVAACGGGQRHTRNHMISSAVHLDELGAPHILAVVRSSDGLNRVWLDTGIAATIPGGSDAFVVDTDTTIYVENGMYVIRRIGEAAVTIETTASSSRLRQSGDGSYVVAVTSTNGLAIISTADLSVRPVMVPFSPAQTERELALDWDSATVLLARRDDMTFAIDVATGAVEPTSARHSPRPSGFTGLGAESLSCEDAGIRIEQRRANKRTDLVRVPLAGAASPETLGDIEPRVLVSATNYDSPWHGDGAMNLGKPTPTPLSLDAVTPDCRYALFSLEGRVYVLDVASGRYAALASGRSAEIPRTRRR